MWDDNVFGTTNTTGSGQLTFGGQFVDQEADLPLAFDPSGNASWDFQFTDLGKLLGNLGIGSTSGFGQVLGGISSLLGGKSGSGQLGSLLGSAGLGLLLNRLGGSNAPAPVGYQGGIPQYTIERAQTPIAQQRPAGYRPGQGGITYFDPIRYTSTGRDLGAPSAPAPAPVPRDTETPEVIAAASGGAMPGGIAMLAKGRYIEGNGDGVSDSVPAKFVGSGRPALLSDGEFVFPARIVAELGNGSNKAGANKLYAFMDRVEAKARSAKRGKPSGADKELNRLA